MNREPFLTELPTALLDIPGVLILESNFSSPVDACAAHHERRRGGVPVPGQRREHGEAHILSDIISRCKRALLSPDPRVQYHAREDSGRLTCSATGGDTQGPHSGRSMCEE